MNDTDTEQDKVHAVRTADFSASVVAASEEMPVLVDFWAPWCGPCRMLSPILGRLAERFAGKLRVVKVNTDEEPELAHRYGIQGIPALKVFKNRQIALELTGVRPEHELEALILKLLPTEADALAEQGAEQVKAGHFASGRQLLETALALDARNAKALLGLAELEVAEGHWDEAEPLLLRVPPAAPEASEADRMLALVKLARAAGAMPTEAEAEAALAAHPGHGPSLLALGMRLALRRNWEPAIVALLDAVRAGGPSRSQAQEGVVAVFTTIGAQHELTRAYRPKLAALLY